MSAVTPLPVSPWVPQPAEQHHPEALFEVMERRFASICTRLEAKRNKVICNQGEALSSLYLVKKGEVLLTRLSPDGREVLLAILGPGEFFGESSLLSSAKVPYSASATRQSELLQLPAKQFNILLEDPRACRIVLDIVLQRCEDAWTQMEVLGCAHARDKVRSGLRWLSERMGVETREGIRIDLNQTQLACMVGCARETLNRELSELRRLRAIDVRRTNGRNSIFVIFPQRLV